MFHSNKVSLNQIKICSNQINFCLKLKKLYLWPYTNAIICLLWRKIYLIQTNFYLAQRYFVPTLVINSRSPTSAKHLTDCHSRQSVMISAWVHERQQETKTTPCVSLSIKYLTFNKKLIASQNLATSRKFTVKHCL